MEMVIVSGKIGCGKSTLCKKLEALGLRVQFELGVNPYLAGFYEDLANKTARNAYPMQLFMLTIRYIHYAAILASGEAAVFDRAVWDDRIFMLLNHHLKNIADDERDEYEKLFSMLAATLPTRGRTVYLDASVETVQRRIMRRSRSCESEIPDSYHDLLGRFYREQRAADEANGLPWVVIDYNTDDDAAALAAALAAVQTLARAGPPVLVDTAPVVDQLLSALRRACAKHGVAFHDPRDF